MAGYTDELAALLAEQTGASPDDPEAGAVASALMGAHRALIGYVRTRVARSRRRASLADDARTCAERVFARLEHGFADYAAGQE